jgi:hypothetical protein
VAHRKLANSVLSSGTTVCLATAHHAKFPDAVRRAVGKDVKVPIEPTLKRLETLPQEKYIIPATSKAVKNKMYSIMIKPDDASPRHHNSASKGNAMKRRNTPHPTKGILKRKTLKRTETSSVLNAVSSILWGGQRSGIDSIDFQTVQIVLGSMVAGVAVGLGVYYWSRRREGTRK